MTKKDVSIIIVNYNVKDLLLKCLDSIYTKDTPVSYDVVVVDNASTDGSVGEIRKKYPSATIIANDYNAGFPAANNQGIDRSLSDYVFLLNPDTELISDAVGELVSYLRDHPDIEVVAPKLLNSDRSHQESAWRFPKIRYILAEMFYAGRLTPGKAYSEKNFDEQFEVDSASGAALFFRRSLIDRVGGLNEKLFWIEDIDFCYRVLKAGGKIIYYPGVSIVHHSGQSARKNYKVSLYNMIVNKVRFYKVHKSGPELMLVYLLSITNVVMRLVVFGLLSPFSSTYRRKWLAYLYTISRVGNWTSDL